jgi:hypothetical protein
LLLLSQKRKCHFIGNLSLKDGVQYSKALLTYRKPRSIEQINAFSIAKQTLLRITASEIFKYF